MIEHDDDRILQAVRTELDRCAENTDGATLSLLNQARHRALEAAAGSGPRRYLLPAAGALATAVLVLAVVVTLPRQQGPQEDIIEDLDVISTSDSLDLYEDLEFYQWLEDYA